MKRQGCSILFVNDQAQVLLLLRDDGKNIPCPNMWDLPGGQVEPGESPAQAIAREIKEEMGLDVGEFGLFSVKEYDDRWEHTFWKRIQLDIALIRLQEGQCLRWFTEEEAKRIKLAFGFNQVVEDFYKERPFDAPQDS